MGLVFEVLDQSIFCLLEGGDHRSFSSCNLSTKSFSKFF
jgi:hypothetical protein